MTLARAWQEVKPLEGEHFQRVGYVEFDLADQGRGGHLSLRYRRFAPTDPLRRMAEFAQLVSQFGPQTPQLRSVLAFCRSRNLQHFSDRYASSRPPEYEGASVVSADAAEATVLFEAVRRGSIGLVGPKPDVLANRAGTNPCDEELLRDVLDRLWAEGRIVFIPAGRSDYRIGNRPPDSIDLLIPFSGTAGLLSDEAPCVAAAAAFNGGFFVWWDTEFDDPYSYAFDHVGLAISEGEVLSAPLYRRSALLTARPTSLRYSTSHGSDGVVPCIRRMSLAQVATQLPGGVIVQGPSFGSRALLDMGASPDTALVKAALNPLSAVDGEAAIFNRRRTWVATQRTCERTPPSRRHFEFVVSGREVGAVREEGDSYIPKNGFVISLPQGDVAERVLKALSAREHMVRFAVDLGAGLGRPDSGVQVGPLIVDAGQPVDLAASLDLGDEEYVLRDERGAEPGLIPVYLSRDALVTASRARIGFGIHPDRRCYVVHIEGCDRRSYVPGSDSVGGTNEDLVKTFLSLGCQEAVALDGGGSAQILWKGHSLTRVSDRHDLPLIASERAVPGCWEIRGP